MSDLHDRATAKQHFAFQVLDSLTRSQQGVVESGIRFGGSRPDPELSTAGSEMSAQQTLSHDPYLL